MMVQDKTQDTSYKRFLAMDVGITIVAYEGVCTHEIVVQLGKELEHLLAASTGVRFKKVFGVFIELIQNIKNYSSETALDQNGTENGVGIIRVSEESLCYTVTAGNCISKNAWERIEAKCAAVKQIPTPDLRTRYNELLRQSQESTSKGAGVGFLDIAIKAGGNWEYEFHPINDEFVFFTITAFVSKGKIAEEDAKAQQTEA